MSPPCINYTVTTQNDPTMLTNLKFRNHKEIALKNSIPLTLLMALLMVNSISYASAENALNQQLICTGQVQDGFFAIDIDNHKVYWGETEDLESYGFLATMEMGAAEEFDLQYFSYIKDGNLSFASQVQEVGQSQIQLSGTMQSFELNVVVSINGRHQESLSTMTCESLF